MPRLVAIQRPEEISRQAQAYVKSYILFPSGLVGLICLVGGVGGLGYQWLATDRYTWGTFSQSSALLLGGVLLGWGQTRYQQFVFRRFPHVLAARMRRASVKSGSKHKKGPTPIMIEHAGRRLVPVAYGCGVVLLIGSALIAASYGDVHAVAALFMPWAGFYWARLFFWRRLVS